MMLTIIQFVGIVLFFEPTEKCDDFDMCCYLYGAFNGVPDYHMLYSNVILGRILQNFVSAFPQIPWYIVYHFCCIFLSMYFINKLLCEKNFFSNELNIINFCIVFFLAYEFYIRFTFTKVAGLMAVVGMILLADVFINRKDWRNVFIASFFLINAMLIRGSVIFVVIFLFAPTYIFFVIENINKIKTAYFWRVTIYFVAAVLVLYVGYRSLLVLDVYSYNHNPEWSKFMNENMARSNLFDYGVPNYYDYQSEFEKLGISENDYKMWFQDYNYSDREILNEELLEKIRDIEPIQNGNVIYIILQGIRFLTSYSLNKLFVYVYILLLLYFLLVNGISRKKILIVSVINIFMIMSYLILYVRGRIQHHVDVVIVLAGIMLLLFYLQSNRKSNKNANTRICTEIVLVCTMLNSFYSSLTNSSYYQEVKGSEISYRDKIQRNYNNLKLISDDKETLYLLGALETSEGYAAFSITSDVIENDFYGNIFLMNGYAMANYEYVLERYIPENGGIYENIVNNPNIRYYVSNPQLDVADTIANYISEHYQPGTYAQLVRTIDETRVYRFLSAPVCLSEDYSENEDIRFDAICSNYGDKAIVSGNIYIEGDDSFAQDVYVEVYNKQTEEKNIYLTVQSVDVELNNETKYEGKYSCFETEIPIVDKEQVIISVILESGGKYYKKSIY